jgi:hypothetical protein
MREAGLYRSLFGWKLSSPRRLLVTDGIRTPALQRRLHMKAKLAAPLTLLFTIIILGLLTISCGSSTISEVPPTETPGKAMEPTPISEDVNLESDDMQSVPDSDSVL